MTILVRPVPKRSGANGIRPFVRPPVNNIRPITIKNWKPPVPEPLPPAPLLGPKELLGLGALVLAQIWGWLSSRPPKSQGEPYPASFPHTGTVPPAGNTVGAQLMHRVKSGTWEYAVTGDCSSKTTNSGGDGGWNYTSDVTSVSWVFVTGNCGPTEVRLMGKVGASQVPQVLATYFSAQFGSTKLGRGIETLWSGPGAVTATIPQTPVPLPDGYVPPEPETETVKVPVLPPLITPVKPAPQQPTPGPGKPGPEVSPEVVPVEPGPSKPPTTDPAKPPVFKPVRPNSPTGIKDGSVVTKPKDPVKVTDPDWHFPVPGGAPITGNGPQAKPEEMAKELGRLEQKLNSLLNPVDTVPDWVNKLGKAYEVLTSIFGGTTYTLTEFCNPDQDPDYVPRQWNFEAPGALSYPGVLINRMDALASMVDQTLRAKQQTCPPIKPQLLGDWVSVNFLSDEPPPDSKSRLRKLFRYRDQSARPLIDHINHWESFVWEAGPVIVVSKNLSWGTPKVWASTAAEGKRVIQHAADIAGVDLSDPKHQWIVTGSADPRYGRSGTMRVDTRGGEFLRITSRPGPSGPPIGAVPVS